MRLALAVFASCVLVASSHAQEAHVPVDYPTIQAAIDAGASPIYVAPGVYPETLRVGNGETGPDSTALLPEGADTTVTVSAMTMESMQHRTKVFVRGFHFLGLVVDHGDCFHDEPNTWDTCRFDQGIYVQDRCGGVGHADPHVLNCLSLGDIYVHADRGLILDCTVWGTIYGVFSEAGGGVGGCVVHGPGTVGITVGGSDAHSSAGGNFVTGVECGIRAVDASAGGNTIRNCSRVGIEVITALRNPNVSNNRISDIAGDGIILTTIVSRGAYFVNDNVITRCSGNGISGDEGASPILIGNQIDSVGQCGIAMARGGAYGNVVRWTGSHGIDVHGEAHTNTVLFAGGDGLRASSLVDGNVVGRCVGNGIVASQVHGNTSYLNGGDGFVVSGGGDLDTLRNNISFGNTGYGLRWTGLDSTVVVTCNDWFGNEAGISTGIGPGDGDLFVDPIFCDVVRDSVSLRFDSPLLDAPGCGLIGARGQGCDVPTETLTPGGPSAPQDTLLRLALMPPVPNPGRGSIAISFTLPAAMNVRVAIVDVQGREVAELADGRLTSGHHAVRWAAGGRSGMYFVTMEAAGTRLVQRVTVLQ